MSKYPCPHCGEPAVSSLRRMFLGPAAPTKCPACGKSIGVSYVRSFLAILPFFLILGLLPIISINELQSFWLGAMGVVITSILHSSMVPLEKR